jgi:hypothetical protein
LTTLRADDRAAKLADAQFIVAREYGACSKSAIPTGTSSGSVSRITSTRRRGREHDAGDHAGTAARRCAGRRQALSASFYVRDVDALYSELLTKGADVEGEPVSQPWGLREFSVRDLERNR